jgi:hypothetical protein
MAIIVNLRRGVDCGDAALIEVSDGDEFIRKIQLACAGDSIEQHLHHFDHVTEVHAGSIRLQLDQKQSVLKTGDSQNVPKEARHGFTALEANTEVWCRYKHRYADGTVAPSYQGDLAVYAGPGATGKARWQ